MVWRGLSTLQWALLVSVGVHAAVLTVRVVNPEAFNRVFEDTPLEVILVNARSEEAPQRAQAIAQASLAGGGESDKGGATSPLPPTPQIEVGDAPADAHRRIDKLQEEQQQLLAQIRREVARCRRPTRSATTATRSAPSRTSAAASCCGCWPKSKNASTRRTRAQRSATSARPRAKRSTPIYYDSLRRKIEARGTRDFPQYRGRKLYGELTMNVTVDSKGRVVDAEIVRPSSKKLLDQRALAIVRAAAPFGPFNAAMRKKADQIVITSRFRFTRDDGLETSLSSATAQ